MFRYDPFYWNLQHGQSQSDENIKHIETLKKKKSRWGILKNKQPDLIFFLKLKT